MVYGNLVREQEFLYKAGRVLTEANDILEEYNISEDTDLLEEGANMEAFKRFRAGKKEFKKNWKAIGKTDDVHEAEKYYRNCEKALDDMEKDIKDTNGGVSSFAIGIITAHILDMYLDSFSAICGIYHISGKILMKSAKKALETGASTLGGSISALKKAFIAAPIQAGSKVFRLVNNIIKGIDTTLTISKLIKEKKKDNKEITIDDFNLVKARLLSTIDNYRMDLDDVKQAIFAELYAEERKKEKAQQESFFELACQEQTLFTSLTESIGYIEYIEEGEKFKNFIESVKKRIKVAIEWLKEKFKALVKNIKVLAAKVSRLVLPDVYSNKVKSNKYIRFNPYDYINNGNLATVTRDYDNGIMALKRSIEVDKTFENNYIEGNLNIDDMLIYGSPLNNSVSKASKADDKDFSVMKFDNYIDSNLESKMGSGKIDGYKISINVKNCKEMLPQLEAYCIKMIDLLSDMEKIENEFYKQIAKYNSANNINENVNDTKSRTAIMLFSKITEEMFKNTFRFNLSIGMTMTDYCNKCIRAAFSDKINGIIDDDNLSKMTASYDKVAPAAI